MLTSVIMMVLASSVVTQAAVFAASVHLYRSASCHAFVLNPFVEFWFRFVFWMTTGIAPRQWVAVYRKHHALTDEEGDPQSPQLIGFWSIQPGNTFHYVKAARDKDVVEKHARDLEPDGWDRVWFQHRWICLLMSIAGLCLLLGVWWGLLAALIHTIMSVFVLSSSINNLCHYTGHRNFKNTLTNFGTLALLTGGEGLYNHHHWFPRSPKFSLRSTEFDPAWPVLKLTTQFKLAEPYRLVEQGGLSPQYL